MRRRDEQSPAVVVNFRDRCHPSQGSPFETSRDNLCDAIPLIQPDNCVNPFDFLSQHLAHPLGETPGDDNFPDMASPFLIHGLSDRANRLRLGWGDEPAGIDDHNIRPVGVAAEDKPRLSDLRQHDLAVDVFRTPRTTKPTVATWF